MYPLATIKTRRCLTTRFLLISEEWNQFRRRLLRAEVELLLLVAFWVLFPPKFQQERRHGSQHCFRSANLGMAGRAKRDHQVQDRFTGYPVMNHNRPFVATGSIADAATVAIAFQNRFAQATEILPILPFQRVAGCT